ELRGVTASYVAGAAVMAAVGAFEVAKSWPLYAQLDEALGAPWLYSGYLTRDGALRATGTAGQAIAYGFSMAVALVLLVSLRRGFVRLGPWLWAIALLILATACSFSRGPWLGALAGFVVYVLSAPGGARKILGVAIVGAAMALFALATPIGESLMRPLTVDQG